MSETFPQTSVTVTPDGIQIVIPLASGLAMIKTIGETDMNELCRQWLETRRQVRAQQHLIADVMKSKRVD